MILVDEFPRVCRPGKMYLECKPHRKDPLQEVPQPFADMTDAVNWARSVPYEPVYILCSVKDGNAFVCTSTAELWGRLLQLNPRTVWLYNATLALSWVDSWLLKQKRWKLIDSGEMADRTYKDLFGASGQRYRLTMAQNYRGTEKGEDKRRRLRHVNFFDFQNLIAGGLDACYSSMGSPEIPTFSDEYAETRRNAVIMGLALPWYDSKLYDLTGVHINRDTPEALTIGSAAKNIMLEALYKKGSKAANKKEFLRVHQMTQALDQWYRSRWIYAGGVTYLSSQYKGQYMPEIWRRDQNMKYGHNIKGMREIVGRAKRLTYDEYERKKRAGNPDQSYFVFVVVEIDMHLLDGMAPIYKDPHLKVNRSHYAYTARGEEDALLYFDFELDELYNWYEIDLSVAYVMEFQTRENFGFSEAVDRIFAARQKAKEEGDKVFSGVCKLLMVCMSGKLAEDPIFPVYEKTIDERDGMEKTHRIGEKVTGSFLDIRQGAYITAIGRTEEMRDIRLAVSRPADSLVYADTDSMHTTEEPQNLTIDPDSLGAYKDENGGTPFTSSMYLAKKIYYNAKPEPDGTVTDYDVRTAGTPRETVKKRLDGLNVIEVMELFTAGREFACEASVMVRGGYVKIPILKQLARDEKFIVNNYGGSVDLMRRET